MINIVHETFARYKYLINIVFPFLIKNTNPWESDYIFNLNSVRTKMQSYINDRTEDSKANEKYDDIL